jgi:hypothetical protein
LLEEERKNYWKRICAAIDDKSTEIPLCFRAIIDERIREITTKLIKKRPYINLTVDDISEITGTVATTD